MSGMIRHMAEMKDMYFVTKLVSSPFYRENTANEKNLAKATNELVEMHMSSFRFRKVNGFNAIDTVTNTIKAGYIEKIGDSKQGYAFKLVSLDGHHLIAKKAYFFRVGLYDETLKHYSTTRDTILRMLATSAITAIITAVAARLLA